MDALLTLWQRLSVRHEALATPIAWSTIAAAVAIVVFPPAWRLARHAVTIVHEGGHATAATLSGRRLSGIRLHSDTSGLTLSRGRARGIGMIVTLIAGYSAPSLLGFAAAWMLSLGYDVGLLWALLLALALLLVQVRNWFGLWSVAITGAVLFCVTWFGSPFVQDIFALLVTAFLLIGAPRTVLELQRSRRRHSAGASDADQLASLTHLPGIVWVGIFLLIGAACGLLGAKLLGLL